MLVSDMAPLSTDDLAGNYGRKALTNQLAPRFRRKSQSQRQRDTETRKRGREAAPKKLGSGRSLRALVQPRLSGPPGVSLIGQLDFAAGRAGGSPMANQSMLRVTYMTSASATSRPMVPASST